MNAQLAVDHFVARPYRPAADFQSVLELVRSRSAKLARAYPSLADMQELLNLPHIQTATRIWETPAGQLAGYALINYGQTYADLAYEIAPAFANTDLDSAMIAWGEQFFQKEYHGQSDALSVAAHDEQPERIALLERHGFVRDPESVVEMFRALDEPIPPAQPPEGFTLRTLLGEDEVPAWVTLHRAAFGTENMTAESRLVTMHLADYDPELDLVIAAPDGSLAAYVLAAVHAEENALSGLNIGYPDMVATHPAYQGRGLARTLLLESLLRLRARGLQAACLHTSRANLPMQRAAEAAGFKLTGQSWHYAKTFNQNSSEAP